MVDSYANLPMRRSHAVALVLLVAACLLWQRRSVGAHDTSLKSGQSSAFDPGLARLDVDWLDVGLMALTPELGSCFGSQFGALVTSVTSGLRGDTIGLRTGDVLFRVNGRIAPDLRDVESRLGQQPSSLTLGIVRDRREVLLGPLDPDQWTRFLFTIDLRARPSAKGVVVEPVFGGVAARAGLIPGDVVTTFDREVVTDADQLQHLAFAAPAGQPIPVVVVRSGHMLQKDLLIPDASVPAEHLKAVVNDVDGKVVVSADAKDPIPIGGLEKNDIIIEIDGQVVKNSTHLRRLAYALLEPPVTVIRNGARLQVSLRDRRVERPSVTCYDCGINQIELFEHLDVSPIGGSLVDLTDGLTDLAHVFGVDAGVLVASMAAGTPGSVAGIKPCDVITRVEGKMVREKRELRRELSAATWDGNHPAITVVRDRKVVNLKLTVPIVPSRIYR
jgi:S1-C subfamily serine protease